MHRGIGDSHVTNVCTDHKGNLWPARRGRWQRVQSRQWPHIVMLVSSIDYGRGHLPIRVFCHTTGLHLAAKFQRLEVVKALCAFSAAQLRLFRVIPSGSTRVAVNRTFCTPPFGIGLVAEGSSGAGKAFICRVFLYEIALFAHVTLSSSSPCIFHSHCTKLQGTRQIEHDTHDWRKVIARQRHITNTPS